MFKEFKFNFPLTKDILYSKYGNIKEEMEKKSINILIKKRKSHYLSKYKDYLIYDYLFDFIQIKYPLKDSLDKISILAKYYNFLSNALSEHPFPLLHMHLFQFFPLGNFSLTVLLDEKHLLLINSEPQ